MIEPGDRIRHDTYLSRYLSSSSLCFYRLPWYLGRAQGLSANIYSRIIPMME
jgi:hypothetical protein